MPTIADIVGYLKNLVKLSGKTAGDLGDRLTDEVIDIFDSAKAKLERANAHYHEHIANLESDIDDALTTVEEMGNEASATKSIVEANAKRVAKLAEFGS